MTDWPGPRGKERGMPLQEFELFQKVQEKMKLDREAELAAAERRGYAKAIEEAATVCDQCPDSHWGPWIKKHILALREKPTVQE